jgi:cytochrome c6
VAGLLFGGIWSEARAADIFKGKKVYEKHCASCHGQDGKPLLPGTPDFQRGEGLFAPDASLMQSLKTGKGTMPGYDHIIPNKDILNALAYSRTLQQ